MSFLFKSSKKQQANALPNATRNIKSSDGTGSGSTSALQSVAPSISQSLNNSAPPLHQTLNGNGAPSAQAQMPASSMPVGNPLGEKSSMRTLDGAQYNPVKVANTPSPDQQMMRERADSEPQQNNIRTIARSAGSSIDSSPYPWSQRPLNYTVSTNLPFPRYGAAVNSVASKDGAVYIMGGLINGSTVKGDLWMVESAPGNLTCYPVATTSEGPGPRVGHASLLVGNAFIVFGGDTKTDDTDMLDDTLYLLNTSTKQWSRAAPAGPRPPGRYGHSLNILGSKIYIFGGQVEGFFFNDLVAFDLNALQQASNRWEVLIQNTIEGGPPHGQIPPARTNHSMITWNDKLYLFGGTDGVTWFNDVWSYDPRTNSWAQLECIGYIPAAREGHASALVGDVMYIFGGRTEEGNDLGDLAAFRISSRRWYTFQNMGPSPSPRSGHSMTAFGKHIVVLGGEPSSAPRDAGELSQAYYLDTSKIRYPADSQSQTPSEQRVQGVRRPSGERGEGSQRGMSPRNPMDPTMDGPQNAMPMPMPANRSIESAGVGASMPRANAAPTQLEQYGQPPRVASPQSRQPMRPERPFSPPEENMPSANSMSQTYQTSNDMGPSRDLNGPVSPIYENEPRFVEGQRDGPLAQQKLAPQQSYPVNETNGVNGINGVQTSRDPSRSGPRVQQADQIPADRIEEPQRMSIDRKSSMSRRADSKQQDGDRELPIDSGLGSSPATAQQNQAIIRELEMEKSKNAWYASELALARKAGYSRSVSDAPALDDRSAEVFGDEDRPLVEALLKMRAELAKVQGSIDNQMKSAAAKIAEVERQRDAAVSEAVFVKAKLAAHGSTPPQFDSRRDGTPDAERAGDMNRRLASSLATQTELSRKIDSLTKDNEGEKQARHLAEESHDNAQKRVTELDMDRQRHTAEIESLRGELHTTQKTARETAANHSEIQSAHQLLTLDHTELREKHDRAIADSQSHTSIIESLREALAASTDKQNLLEQQLEEARSSRNELEEKHTQLRSQHEERTAELENTTRRLRDTESLAEKHAAEARTHRQAVLSGLDKLSSRDVGNSSVTDERVAVLQQQVEEHKSLARDNQSAADSASERLRRAEERIAGLEAYQEQTSREGLSMRKQLQVALRDVKALNEEKTGLQQQLQSQMLETNAIAVQHGALKNILSERGINPAEARKSRNVESSPSTTARFGTPDLQRVKELEMQLEASLKSHDDMKSHFEEIQTREGVTRKEYEEKLSTLDNDHQAAVRYLRGTEKMLAKMKSELQRVKNQNTDYSKELETLKAKEAESRSVAETQEHPTGARNASIGSIRSVKSAQWEQERDGLRKDLESVKTDLASKVSSLQRELDDRESDLAAIRASQQSSQSDYAALRSTHDASRADLERLKRENHVLEDRARDAEKKVQLLLDQVEHSVDNYRRQSSALAMTNGGGHSRGYSNASVSTMMHPAERGGGHSRGPSTADSIYSQTGAPPSITSTNADEGPDGRNSLALDSLASELDALRSHWETTKNYRQSERFDYDKTPTAGTQPNEFSSLASWRRGLELGDEDDASERPSTAGSVRSKAMAGNAAGRVVSPVAGRLE